MAEESYGLMWVAVHRTNSMCMVARHSDLDMTRVGPLFKGISKDLVINYLTTAVLSDVEDFPDEKSESLGVSIKGPFGVVSVNPAMYWKRHEHAVTYLEEKVRECVGPAFTVDETIHTAIRAFQQLCLEEVKAEDIYVNSLKELHKMTVRLSTDEIKQHLQVNNRGLSSPDVYSPENVGVPSSFDDDIPDFQDDISHQYWP